MRELQLWTGTETLDQMFADVDTLAASCPFRDCSHTHEPGCRVRAAAEDGRLPPGRLDGYHKLQAELRHLSRRQDARAQIEEKRRWKTIHKAMRRRRDEH